MINSVVLVGRTTKDLTLRTDKNGESYVFITLAVQVAKDLANFFDCLLTGKNAENASNLLSKGALVGVQGRLATRTYETPESKRTETYVRVKSFEMLSSGNKLSDNDVLKPNNNKGYITPDDVNTELADDELPF